MRVGRHEDTLKGWAKRGLYEPSGFIDIGLIHIKLYSEEDIYAMIELANTLHVGRPRKQEE